MPLISLESFGGRVPRLASHLLPAHNAQVAQNCDTLQGNLQPRRGIAVTHAIPKAGELRSLSNLAGNWLAWAGDVDVVASINSPGRIHYTGDGAPKQSDSTMAVSGAETDWPTLTHPLGIAQPDTALSVQLGSTSSGVINRTCVYSYTLVTEWGEESMPSLDTAAFEVADDQSVTLTGFAVPAELVGYVTHYRVYRSVAGSVDILMQQVPWSSGVSDMPVSETQLIDTEMDDGLLGGSLPSATWRPPEDTMQGLISFGNGLMAGFVGQEVFLAEPAIPYAYPWDNIISTDAPVVGLGFFDSTLVICTDANPIVATGYDPVSIIPSTLPEYMPCLSKRGIVSTKQGVFYPSFDGLFQIGSGGSGVVTAGLFTKDQWNDLNLANLIAVWHDNRYYAFFEGSTEAFYIEFGESSQVFDISLPYPAYALHQYGESIFLMVDNGGYQVIELTAGDLDSFRWKSRAYLYGSPTYMTTGNVMGDFSEGACSLALYGDGALVATATLIEPGIFRLRAGHRAKRFEVELTGKATIDALYLGQSTTEVTGG